LIPYYYTLVIFFPSSDIIVIEKGENSHHVQIMKEIENTQACDTWQQKTEESLHVDGQATEIHRHFDEAETAYTWS